MNLSYLAGPYTHDDENVRFARYQLITQCAAKLKEQGYHLYSPITHGHKLAANGDLPTDFEYWRSDCIDMLRRCDDLIVLTMPGWQESRGVKTEIETAEMLNYKIVFMSVEGLGVMKNG